MAALAPPGQLDSASPARWAAPRALRAAAFGAGPLLAATYMSLLVLVPVAAVIAQAFSGGPGQLWQEVTQPETLAAIKLSVASSGIVVAINLVAGTAIAWLLVRDRRFVGNRVIGLLVDLPFALPTVVAGVTILALYGADSPVHVDIAFSRVAILVALLFVTLPFAVRSVQPVLEALDRETEEAAASLGASSFTTFRKVILPALGPALLTGAGLAFARAVGEYGSVVLVSGNVPLKTEVASFRIFSLVESDNLPAAAAAAFALFLIALVVLGCLAAYRRHLLRAEADS